MKEYEKLAEEYLLKEYAGESRDEVEPSFIAGFLKAREMAVNMPFVCRNDLEKLGEKEVEIKKDPTEALRGWDI